MRAGWDSRDVCGKKIRLENKGQKSFDKMLIGLVLGHDQVGQENNWLWIIIMHALGQACLVILTSNQTFSSLTFPLNKCIFIYYCFVAWIKVIIS